MIRLRLDTTYLDLTDASIQLSIHNPIFDQENSEAVYTFPFQLPPTSRNLTALAHPNRLDNPNNTVTFSGAVLEIGGMLFIPGVLELDGQAFSRNGFTAVFRNEVPDLADELADIKIHEILETITPTPVEAVWVFGVTTPPPGTYTIVLSNVSYQYTAVSDQIFEVADGLRDLINAAYPGLADVNLSSQLTLDAEMMNDIPFTNSTNIEVVDTITRAVAAMRAMQAHVDSVNQTPVTSHCFPTIAWPSFYQGNNRGYFLGVFNVWLDGTTIDNEPNADPKAGWQHSYIPFVKLPYILSRIAASTSLVTDWQYDFDDTDLAQLAILNNLALDAVQLDRYDDNAIKYLNGFAASFDLNRHVPEMTAKEFLRRYLDIFELWYTITGTSIRFFKKVDQLAAQPIDWTRLAEPDYTATRKSKEGFRLEYGETEDIYANNGTLPDYTSGGEGQVVTLPFHTLRMQTSTPILGGTSALLPVTNQPGSSDEGGVKNGYQFRLLFFRGLQEAADSSEYPLGTSGYTDLADAEIGDLSLLFSDGTKGLYDTHHKKLRELLADGQPVTLPMRLGLADIITARRWENARRTITLAEGQVTAVIKKITFKISKEGMSVSLVDFVQEK